MGQSKLSVDSSTKADFGILNFDIRSLENYEENDGEFFDYDYNLDHLSWFDSVKGLPKADEVTTDPRLSPKSMIITLNNKGELASTNIKVTILFKGYGSERVMPNSLQEFFLKFKNNMDGPIIKRKLFHSEKVVVKIPYMGAGTTKDFSIAILIGQFREAELVLRKIEANGHTYFKSKFFNSVVINHYEHPFLRDFRSTDKEIVKVLGFHNPDKKLKFKVLQSYNKEGLAWLRSLFVGWLK